MKRIIKLAATALGVAALVVSAGVLSPAKADAAGTSISCVIPDLIYCTISNPDGIASVVVTGDTPFGEIDWVNKTYPGCPTQVQVILGGDHVLSAGPVTFDVTPCQGFKFKDTGRDPDWSTRFDLVAEGRGSFVGVAPGLGFSR